MIVWLTGQPGSGKTTLATKLYFRRVVDFIVDGDDLRDLMPNPGYDRAGRLVNIDRAQTIAAYLHAQGESVAVALVAPYRQQREAFKSSFPVQEVYTHTDDLRGREGYHVEDYEPPLNNFIDVDTGLYSVASATEFLLSELEART